MIASGRTVVGVMVVLVFGILPVRVQAGPVTILFSDSFEAGIVPPWTFTGDWRTVTSSDAAYSGARGADITGATNVGGDTLSIILSTIGYEDLVVSIYSRVRTGGLEGDDQVLFDWSINGTDWQNLVRFEDLPAGDWVLHTLDLPAAVENNPAVTFRLWANLSSSSDRMNFDDLALIGQPIPEPASLSLLGLGSLSTLIRRRVA